MRHIKDFPKPLNRNWEGGYTPTPDDIETLKKSNFTKGYLPPWLVDKAYKDINTEARVSGTQPDTKKAAKVPSGTEELKTPTSPGNSIAVKVSLSKECRVRQTPATANLGLNTWKPCFTREELVDWIVDHVRTHDPDCPKSYNDDRRCICDASSYNQGLVDFKNFLNKHEDA
jgi:hypothetical protein